MLQNRVRRVLSLKPSGPQRGIGRVLRVLVVCVACAAPVLLLSAQAKPLLLHPSDPLFGTWVNPAYESAVVEVSAKWVLTADGAEKDYRKVADVQPFSEGGMTLEAAWVDERGDRWYKAIWVGDYVPPRVNRPGCTGRCLIRVNAAGDLLDILFGTESVYPRDLADSQPRFGTLKQYRRL